MKIVCIHGFLGSSKDWMSLELEKHLGVELVYLNMFGVASTILPYWEWASAFNSTVSQGSILVGYSLGGRLAMHAVLHSPHLYKGVVIISSHYGLNSANEKISRLKHDQTWAKRFREEKWESVIHDWNTQPVFQKDTHTFSRDEKELSRKSLSLSLDVWSLGRQDFLKDQIEQLSVPTLFIAGDQDTRYSNLARNLKFTSTHSNIWIATESGHRVPWQQPNKFIRRVSLFIEEAGKKWPADIFFQPRNNPRRILC